MTASTNAADTVGRPRYALAVDGGVQQRIGTKRYAPRAHDPTFYPTEKKVGQDILQRLIVELLRPLVERWLALRGKPTLVGADQFIYYKRFHPEKVVAPHLYVLPGVKPGRRIKSWKVWETGIVPSFALEVVASAEPEKEYVGVLERYAELGVDELVVFDPDHELDEDRVRWQRYRRLERGFEQVETSNADRIRSRVLRCFLRAVGSGDDVRLRLGRGRTGDDLVPTEAEAERAVWDAERAAEDAARTTTEQALRRVAELEALVAKLRRQKAR